MELYVGMDVSLKETSICVVDGSGEIVSEGTVISEPAKIAGFIEAEAGSALRIGPSPRAATSSSMAVISDKARAAGKQPAGWLH